MSWAHSTRRARLPREWRTIRALVLAREPRCTCTNPVHWWHVADPCGMASTDVDHVQRGDDHRAANLAGLCRQCHASKTSAEGNAARQRVRRPIERHPGLLPPITVRDAGRGTPSPG